MYVLAQTIWKPNHFALQYRTGYYMFHSLSVISQTLWKPNNFALSSQYSVIIACQYISVLYRLLASGDLYLLAKIMYIAQTSQDPNCFHVQGAITRRALTIFYIVIINSF